MQAFEGHDPEQLLLHGQWVSRLAVRLVRDVQQAEELTQEAWAIALGTPAHKVGDVRAWLGGILRKLVLKRRMHEGRERQGQDLESLVALAPAPEEILAREAARRNVVAAVLDRQADREYSVRQSSDRVRGSGSDALLAADALRRWA